MPYVSDRLKQVREALGLSQQALADLCQVGVRSQRNYESGERAPDATYLSLLAEAGGDVTYILTGRLGAQGVAVLTAEEQTMLDYFRGASKEVRRAALGALLGATSGAGPQVQVGGANSQHSSGAGAVNIGSFGGTPASKRRK